jgi:hypothetical protein
MKSAMETTKLAGSLWANVSCTYQSVQLRNADVLWIHHCILFPRYQVQAQLSRKQSTKVWEKNHLWNMFLSSKVLPGMTYFYS